MSILMVIALDHAGSAIDLASWCDGFARAYYVLKDRHTNISVASLSGGWPWPLLETRHAVETRATARLAHDASAREELADSLRLDQVCVEDYEAAYSFGFPGSVQHPASQSGVRALLELFLNSEKPVVIIPTAIESVFAGTGKGMLITVGIETSGLAAHTLLAVIGAKTAIHVAP